METFDEDMDFIIDHQFPLGRGKHTHRNTLSTKADGQGKFHKELKEYEGLPNDLVEYVMRKYRLDNQQFGYTTEIKNGKYYASCDRDCC